MQEYPTFEELVAKQQPTRAATITGSLIVHLFPALVFVGSAIASLVYTATGQYGYGFTLFVVALLVLAVWLVALRVAFR